MDRWDLRFLALARHVAQWSKDPSTKAGAVVVRGKRIVSLGFNGFPRGMRDDAALYADRESKYSRVVHAEINAILFAERPVKWCTLYTWPFSPCDRCAVQVIQAGVARVVFPALPDDKVARWKAAMDRSKDYFREAAVAFEEIDEEVP